MVIAYPVARFVAPKLCRQIHNTGLRAVTQRDKPIEEMSDPAAALARRRHFDKYEEFR
jgi:hypothetical protein